MPNSPVFFNLLCLGARFSQKARLTTEGFVVALCLGCMQLPCKRLISSKASKMVFVPLKKIQSFDFSHHLPTKNLHKIPSVNTALIKFLQRRFS